MSKASEEWRAVALYELRRIAKEYEFFKADDVNDAMDGQRLYVSDRRVLGTVFQNAMREGWITPTRRHEESHRMTQHHRPLRVWRSLIYEE